jgi:hypothetical protein
MQQLVRMGQMRRMGEMREKIYSRFQVNRVHL